MERESFVFYRSFFEALKKLKPRSRQKALDAIINYALDGVETPLDDAASVLFLAIKPQLDANNKRYVSGKQGGRKPPEKMEDELEEITPENESNGFNEKKPSVLKKSFEKKPNENENVNVNENENVNENVYVNENADGLRSRETIGCDTHTALQSQSAALQSQSDISFSDFWKAYPKRVDKKHAQIEWRRINPDTQTAQRIIDGVGMWAKSLQWQQDGGKYIPHPATYLRTARWEDTDAIDVACAATGNSRNAPASFDIDEFDRYTLGGNVKITATGSGTDGA